MNGKSEAPAGAKGPLRIALVAIAVFFPVVVNTYVGAANIETIYWDVAKNYGASQTVMFTRIVFFGALPTMPAWACSSEVNWAKSLYTIATSFLTALPAVSV